MIKTITYTAFALVAFACNSILCRLALRGEEADAVGFTIVRLSAGAAALVLISVVVGQRKARKKFSLPPLFAGAFKGGSWLSAFYLFAYAICFSVAYLELTAGTGALILFGSVQMTMIVVSLIKGERPGLIEWLGLTTAVAGLVCLVLPGLASPPLVASLLMAAAGAAWGFYTLRGKTAGDPLANTTGNFVRSVPMVAIIGIPFLSKIHLSNYGIILAAVSGAVTSGLGYTIWYAALKHHTPTRAAVLQLAVPIIAAIIGILLLAEAANLRLGVAAALIIGGIAVTIAGRRR